MDRGVAIVDRVASWPARKRINAIKRIVSRRAVEEIVCDRRVYPRLPSWFLVWFMVSMGLFCGDSCRQIFRWLQPSGKTPPRSTFCEARKRLGVAPLRRLMERIVVLLGTRDTPGSFYKRLRLMAVDGFVLDVPDTLANDGAFGRPQSGRAAGAFPQVRCLSLCEVGTHVFYRTLIKPLSCGEIRMMAGLLRFLTADMLLLWDRNFLSYALVQQVIRQGTQLLVRVKKNLVFQPIQVLDDGSYLAQLYASAKDRRHDHGGILVRIIEYTLDDPNRPGHEVFHRLLTTLLDAEEHPAEDLIVLYHERWEEELSIDELKTHQRERAVLRSQTPAGVVQEVYGLLLGHFVVRRLMFEAATEKGLDPDRLSFTGTLKILRCRLAEAPTNPRRLGRWLHNLLSEITEPNERLPPRRNRINPRVIKKKMSNWAKKQPTDRHYPQPLKSFRKALVILH